MNNVWQYLITIWTQNGIEEVLLFIDLNLFEEEKLEFYGEFQEEILNLIKLNSHLTLENAKIHDCKRKYYDVVSVTNYK